ncbi:hypothetical protein CMV_014597 [Castanea mollissima]|uniref:EDS1 EP domain-containing protein n=1 Tax=Castanea mollissima TaxID=60419 RepID=A0A8J4RCE1_9ROSI|nr:hypothetical protein CMV_014597 [Castanea mollissima]
MPSLLPSLSVIEIEDCPQLVASLPSPSALHELALTNCDKVALKELSPKLQSLGIGGCHVTLLEGGLPTTLKTLQINGVLQLPGSHYYPSIESLKVYRDKSLLDLTSLTKLNIEFCPNFVSFPSGGLCAPNLTQISISDCYKLKSLAEGMHTLLPSLLYLKLWDCTELESFPEGGLPSNLQILEIDSCDKLFLRRMEWGLQSLHSLRAIRIWYYGREVGSFPEQLEFGDLSKQLEQLPLSSDSTSSDIATINSALNDLGLSTRARLCLCAAGELEKRKIGNKESIDLKKPDIDKAMKYLEEDYQLNCENRGLGYYDAFKFQETPKDFDANVKRLELAGIWDEIIEMLKRYELPDAFEGLRNWVLLGTRYRRLVEPLDIANYYRHSKNEDTGAYMIKGRPKRYRFTQRWREHADKMPAESSGESCFWAKIEELRIKISSQGFDPIKEEVLQLEEQVQNWINDKELDRDVLLEKSTFKKW